MFTFIQICSSLTLPQGFLKNELKWLMKTFLINLECCIKQYVHCLSYCSMVIRWLKLSFSTSSFIEISQKTGGGQLVCLYTAEQVFPKAEKIFRQGGRKKVITMAQDEVLHKARTKCSCTSKLVNKTGKFVIVSVRLLCFVCTLILHYIIVVRPV